MFILQYMYLDFDKTPSFSCLHQLCFFFISVFWIFCFWFLFLGRECFGVVFLFCFVLFLQGESSILGHHLKLSLWGQILKSSKHFFYICMGYYLYLFPTLFPKASMEFFLLFFSFTFQKLLFLSLHLCSLLLRYLMSCTNTSLLMFLW